MATITKIKNQYRIRFTLFLPSGARLDRSRRVNKKGLAREIKAMADILESKTRRQEYTKNDIDSWAREDLISRRDTDLLGIFHDDRKTLQQAADEYIETWMDITKEEKAARVGRVNRIVQLLKGDTPLHEIRHLDGERLKATLREITVKRHPNAQITQKLKATTINKHLQDLKRLFNVQVAQGTIDYHPFALLDGLKKPSKEKIVPVALSEDQIVEVIRKAEQQDKKLRPPLGGKLTLFLLVFFGSGMRRKEAMNAMVENINWESRTLKLVDTKNGHERHVGLGLRLYNMLLPKKGQTGRILPPFHKETITRTIIRHFRLCGLKMRLHDTRHTYATRLLDLGVDKRMARLRTGHLDERVFTQYDHPETDEHFEDGFSFMQVPESEETAGPR